MKTYKINFTQQTKTGIKNRCEVFYADNAVKARNLFIDRGWYNNKTMTIVNINLIK